MHPRSLLLSSALLLAPPALAEPPREPRGFPNAEVERQFEDARRQMREAMERMRALSKEGFPELGQDGGRVRFRHSGRLGVILKASPEEGATGLTVQGVTPGGAAEKAGVKAGDVLTAIDGEPLTHKGPDRLEEGRRAIHKRLRQLEPGQKVALEILRDGRTQRLELTVTEDAFRGAAAPWLMGGNFELPELPEFRHGFGMHMFGPFGPFRELQLTPLNPDLGQYFGTQEGVLVVRAPPEAQPLRGGDVILKVGDKPAAEPGDVVRALRSYGPEQRVNVEILRQRARQTVSVKIPADAGAAHPR